MSDFHVPEWLETILDDTMEQATDGFATAETMEKVFTARGFIKCIKHVKDEIKLAQEQAAQKHGETEKELTSHAGN